MWHYQIPQKWIMPNTFPSSLQGLVNYLLPAIPIIIALLLIHKRNNIINSLGLQWKGCLDGFMFAALVTLPMFIGAIITGTFNHYLTIDIFISTVIISGFCEELFFHGYLFGQLFRFCRWGFIPALLIKGLVFGMLGIYRGHDIYSVLSAFGTISLVTLVFCWVYAEWNNNLWIAIWLHTLMNCSWTLFQVSPTLLFNLFFGMTILLIIVGIILYKKYYKLRYNVRWDTLWKNI